MIRINKDYTHLFKFFGNAYNYNIKPGIWLSFDKDTLEYIGIEMFYLASFKEINVLGESKINDLISKGILEVID